MTDAPERIEVSTKSGISISYAGREGTFPAGYAGSYILDTPEALAKSPHVEALVKAAVEAERGAAELLRAQAASAALILRHYQIGEPVADMLQRAVAEFDAAAIREVTP